MNCHHRIELLFLSIPLALNHRFKKNKNTKAEGGVHEQLLLMYSGKEYLFQSPFILIHIQGRSVSTEVLLLEIFSKQREMADLPWHTSLSEGPLNIMQEITRNRQGWHTKLTEWNIPTTEVYLKIPVCVPEHDKCQSILTALACNQHCLCNSASDLKDC